MKITRTALARYTALLAIAAFTFSCSFSTANLSSLKIGKDKAVTQETNNFSGTDTVYAVATVSNVPGKVKVKGRIVIEDVPGQQAGPVPGLETTLDLESSGAATFTFTPPPDGWPKGKYKIEAVMLNEQGEQKDQKSASFSVS
jgi:hypothetical protein